MGQWKDCRNLLVIRLDNMGDVIMNNAALQEIKHQMPACKITLLASKMAVPIIPYLGTIDDYIQYDAPWMKLTDQDTAASTEALVHVIKALHFDGCLIFNVYSQNPMAAIFLAYLAGIPKRAAYLRENPYSLLTDWVPDQEPLFQVQHQIIRDLSLLTHLGISEHTTRLPALQLPDSPCNLELPRLSRCVILNYDVSEEKRRIPLKIARELIQNLLSLDYQVLLVGKDDNDYLANCRKNIQSPRLTNLIGKTSIQDLLLLIPQAKAVITVNTGLVHMACALKVPTLVLYAQTNPQHIPWSQESAFILYPVEADKQSKNTINIFVDNQHNDSENPPLTTANILEKFSELLMRFDLPESEARASG